MNFQNFFFFIVCFWLQHFKSEEMVGVSIVIQLCYNYVKDLVGRFTIESTWTQGTHTM